MEGKPHQHALRIGRRNIPGAWYVVTTCIEGRRYLLIPDPWQPHREPLAARIVEESIRSLHHARRWRCQGYVVMPDHVHIVFALGERQTLGRIMASFGKYTARRLNALSGRQGRVWQHGFYDHCLRDERSYLKHLRYVIENPVRKGWVTRPEDWPYAAIEPDW